MRLQINACGAWRDVFEFDAVQLRAVQEAVVPLAQAVAINIYDRKSPSWRITSTGVSKSPKVHCHLDAPKFSWRRV